MAAVGVVFLVVTGAGCATGPEEQKDCIHRPERPYDGRDQDCDGEDLVDVDADGFAGMRAGGDDCDDEDRSVNPVAQEVCNELDDDCDGLVDDADDSVTGQATWYVDADGDGFGNDALPVVACKQPSGTSARGGDCNDSDAWDHPGAPEEPYNGIDDDCVGGDVIDVDGDGYVAEEAGGDDCDDVHADAHPGGVEVPYDWIDQDCDGWDLVDVDGDGQEGAGIGGADCDDTDPAINTHAIEIPYDGIDQDCDGGDLADADGDGFDAVEAGGTDCDDDAAWVNPDAGEVPYDGIDQDCSGGDANDLDGDGEVATEAGGDDCDDADATISSRGAEVAGTRTDEDCDGLVDEVIACGDGTGDWLTIQEAVDAAPDGGNVEVCPGTYVENVVIDHDLTLQGGGDDPTAVVLRGANETGVEFYSTSYAVSTSGTGLDVAIRRLSFDHPWGFFGLELGSLAVTEVYACPEAGMSTAVYAGLSDSVAGGQITIRRSWFCTDPADESVFENSTYTNSIPIEAFAGNDEHETLTIAENVFLGSTDPLLEERALAYIWLAGADCVFRNNLVVGGGLRLYESGADLDNGSPQRECTIGNNTFVDVRLATQSSSQAAFGYDRPAVGLQNNIFSNVGTFGYDSSLSLGDSGFLGLWNVSIYDWEGIACPADPDEWSANLLYEVEAPWSYLVSSDCDDDLWCESATTTYSDCDAVSVVSLDSILADPMFTSDERGSYGLDPASPAVDAGVGSDDPDGSPADLGAFGGRYGDWYSEVPWPMP